MKSGSKDKRRIGNVVMTLLTGVSSVVGLSGFSLKDALDQPSSPLPAIVYTLSPEDCHALGLDQPPLPTSAGTAANPTATVDVQAGGTLNAVPAANATATADVQLGGGMNAEFKAGSGLQEEARTDDSVSSFPQGPAAHDEARTDDTITFSSPEIPDQVRNADEAGIRSLGDGVIKATSTASGTLGTAVTDEEHNVDGMVLEFLRQRLNERSGPVRPEAIGEALPLEIEEVQSSLARLLEANAIEGQRVEELDYPVMVTRLR
jgi:hypothetical protein